MQWWEILIIIFSSLTVIYVVIVRPKTLLNLWNFGGIISPLLTFISLFLPLITIAGLLWWKACLILIGVMLITMVLLTLNNSTTHILKILPTLSVASLTVLIVALFDSLANLSKMNGPSRVLSTILGIVSLIYVLFSAVGNGNIVAGTIISMQVIKTILSNNPARLTMLLLLCLYIIFSVMFFTSSNAESKKTWTTVMNVFNIIWATFGILLAIWFYSATVENFPNDIGIWSRFKQIFTGNGTMMVLKILAVIILSTGLIVGTSVMLGNHPSITNVLAIMVQAFVGLLILTNIYRYISNHPRIMAAIMGNSFIRLIFNLIFIIPCALISLGKGVGKGVNNVMFLPKSNNTYILLFAEIILISAYILMPALRKWMYTFSPGSNQNIATKQKIHGSEESIILAKQRLKIAKGAITDVDWQKIYTEQLYLKDTIHTQLLNNYLTSLGYQTTYSPARDNILTTSVLGKPISIDVAMSFIQTNNRTKQIMTYAWDLKNLETKLEALNKQKDAGGPFKSEILLNKPHYINKVKFLGLYENLKGGTDVASRADNYNYNYGLSCWIYLMAQGPEYGLGYTKFTKILDYGNKPALLYNPEKNTFKIMVKTYGNDVGSTGATSGATSGTTSGTTSSTTSSTTTAYDKVIYKTKSLPLQRWNNVVINCAGGTIDVFINNKLVSSVNNVVPYMSPDTITIGDNPGISGSVANVTYFSAPLTKSKIALFYNSLVNKNPPVV